MCIDLDPLLCSLRAFTFVRPSWLASDCYLIVFTYITRELTLEDRHDGPPKLS